MTPYHQGLKRRKVTVSRLWNLEAEVAAGLESFAEAEISVYSDTPPIINTGAVAFNYYGELEPLLHLKTITSLYLRSYFAIPRPRALLGHEHLNRLLESIQLIREQPFAAPSDYTTLYLSAAGSDTSVMQRLREELCQHTELKPGSENGDLLIRLRRSGEGWDVLIRITPRPLATRAWRECNFEGALNGPVAHCMILLTQPKPNDVYVNLACGSGTLLIERLNHKKAACMVGVDNDSHALLCATNNIAAANHAAMIDLIQGDASRTPLRNHSADTLTADLPFGNLVGSHQQNLTLYPGILKEAARIAKPGARFVLITHEVRLLETLLSQSSYWSKEHVLRIELRGLTPRIFCLRRTLQGVN